MNHPNKTQSATFERGALICLVVFAATWFLSYGLNKMTTNPGFSLDFEPYYLQAQAIRAHAPAPYDVRGAKLGWELRGTLPLTYALFISPLSFLPLQLADRVFWALNVLALLAGVFLLSKMMKLSSTNAWVLLAAAMFLYPVVHCLACGQVGIILFFLVVLCLFLFQEKKFLLSACVLGIAASVKVTPGFLILVFLVRKRYAYCLTFLLSFLLLQGLTTLLTSWSQTWLYWSEIFPWLAAAKVDYITNQSLIGFLNRVFGMHKLSFPMNKTIALALLGSFAAVLAVRNGFFRFKEPPPEETRDGVLFDVSLLLILINLATSIGWAHHFVWILMPIALLLKWAGEGRFKPIDAVLMVLGILLLFFPLEITLPKSGSLRLPSLIMSGSVMFGSLIILLELCRLKKNGERASRLRNRSVFSPKT